MLEFISGAIAGAIVFGLVIKNNPNLAKKLGILVDKIDDQLDKLKEEIEK